MPLWFKFYLLKLWQKDSRLNKLTEPINKKNPVIKMFLRTATSNIAFTHCFFSKADTRHTQFHTHIGTHVKTI